MHLTVKFQMKYSNNLSFDRSVADAMQQLAHSIIRQKLSLL